MTTGQPLVGLNQRSFGASSGILLACPEQQDRGSSLISPNTDRSPAQMRKLLLRVSLVGVCFVSCTGVNQAPASQKFQGVLCELWHWHPSAPTVPEFMARWFQPLLACYLPRWLTQQGQDNDHSKKHLLLQCNNLRSLVGISAPEKKESATPPRDTLPASHPHLLLG